MAAKSAAAPKVKLAVVCASNQNRSMEAHYVLRGGRPPENPSAFSQHGFQVQSFGTGSQVKLPGASADRPNVYPFGTPYDTIYEELKAKDQRLYTRNGILPMLERNRMIKRAPERFRDAVDKFDVIICCEERCFDQVLEDLGAREADDGTPVHILNLDIKDNHDDASVGAQHILQLCRMVGGPGTTGVACLSPAAGLTGVGSADGDRAHVLVRPASAQIYSSDDLDNDLQQKVEEFEAATSVPCLHTVAFY